MQSTNSAAQSPIATIIGGHGFIGKALATSLKELGWQLWLPERDDPELFKRELGRVFYCAGLTADYLQRPFDTVNAHVNLLSQVLYKANWEKLVYLSSTRVYDGLSGLVDEQTTLLLNPNNPRHLYDLSKLMGESLCLQTQRASVARLSCVYKNEHDTDGFLPKLLRQAIASDGKNIEVDSSPNYSRDYIYLDDVVSALIAIVESDTSSIYNLASGENITNRDIFLLLGEMFGIDVIPTQHQLVAPSPIINTAKLQDAFGWRAQQLLPAITRILKGKAKNASAY